jgi:hydroxypyruvate isomerase
MPKFAANLSMMFAEVGFVERFAAARANGFSAVEFLFPYEHDPAVIRDLLQQHGLQQALFNMPPGNWAAGERGLASLPERGEEFRASVAIALRYAKIIGCPTLHLMAGLADPRDAKASDSYRAAVAYAAEECGKEGITVTIEPINGRDMPGYFLDDFNRAAEIIAALNLPNLKLQFDIYHRQIIHGDVLTGLQTFLPIIGHVQVASVPKRNEPGTGELDDFCVFRRLDELGYESYVGCEYRPAAETEAGLGWLARAQV